MVTASDATNCVETMEDATKPTREPKSRRGLRILGCSCWRDEFGVMAAIQIATGSSRTEQRLLATVRTGKFSRTIPTSSYLTEPPDADPHVRWCGRGAYAPLSRLAWIRWLLYRSSLIRAGINGVNYLLSRPTPEIELSEETFSRLWTKISLAPLVSSATRLLATE